MRTAVSIFALALAAGLTGCAVGPNYHRPAVLPAQPVPKQFSDDGSSATNHGTWKIAQPSASVPRGEWWSVFNDAGLQQLETLALTNNQNLAAAAARIEQSRALSAAARADFYPQFNAGGTPGGDVTRQRTSANAPAKGLAAALTPLELHTSTTPSPRQSISAGNSISGDVSAASLRPPMNATPPAPTTMNPPASISPPTSPLIILMSARWTKNMQ